MMTALAQPFKVVLISRPKGGTVVTTTDGRRIAPENSYLVTYENGFTELLTDKYYHLRFKK